MIDISAQIIDGALWPFTLEDQEEIKKYRENQVVRCRVKGTRKERSLQQLRLYWVICQIVADNTDDPLFATRELVSFQTKVALHFVHENQTAVTPDGIVQFRYRSISFEELDHAEACGYFDRAFEFLAAKIGVDVATLTREGRKRIA